MADAGWPRLLTEIAFDTAAIVADASLLEPGRYCDRAAAIDTLEFHVLDRIAGLLAGPSPAPELLGLRAEAERARRRLEAVDRAHFRSLRAQIRAGGLAGPALAALLDAAVSPAQRLPLDAPGYDALDQYVNGLLRTQPLPRERAAREPEMVSYQQTPARIILALAERARLTPADCFYDLGSGLGHVPILVHLLTGAEARGVEVEPAYCAQARQYAAQLGLTRVAFTQADARQASYHDGSAFFLYTPFVGDMLRAVLGRLRSIACERPIQVLTYGPCSAIVAQEPWLSGAPQQRSPHALAVFRSERGVKHQVS
jgi:hypothetical protein